MKTLSLDIPFHLSVSVSDGQVHVKAVFDNIEGEVFSAPAKNLNDVESAMEEFDPEHQAVMSLELRLMSELLALSNFSLKVS